MRLYYLFINFLRMKKITFLIVALCATVFAKAGETVMTGFNYVDAIYFTSEEATGSWAFDLYNDYDYDNGTYVYPELYMEVAANGSSTISGTYNVGYALFYTSATDSVEFVAGSLTVSALGTIDGDGFPE